MSTLRTITMALLIIGVIGLFIPTMPGAEALKWACALALVSMILDIFVDRKKKVTS